MATVRNRSILELARNVIGIGLIGGSMLMMSCWVLGLVLGDRWIWSQWLSWIPSLLLIPFGLAWWSGAMMLKRSYRAASPGLVALLIGPGFFLATQWRPGSSIPGEGFTIVQWTVGSVWHGSDDYARVIIETGGDLTLFEGGRRVRWNDSIKEWLGPESSPLSTGIISVLTRFTVTRLQTVIWTDEIYAARLDVKAPGFEEEPLRLLLVDLPSDPARGRQDVATQFRQLILDSEIGPIDLVIGDFNMPLGSTALASLFPDLEEAWHTAGEGWGPTFPRQWALYRVDHIFVGPRVRITNLRTHDPGMGRHRLQTMKIEPRVRGSSQ